ncbi:hypothetical protein [Acidithiobacillus thiooxidans]|uniref:2-isopropylmalate synthase n=1 Tax=Acidithiobacillus thiooxidans TaxID=930 RepID=A0A1C2HWD5_ACITH|nr:hypothetical protein [Acidithiobacillus thiooxidans]MDA8154812.1 hypothetical protein [Acidithiobacillus sp.]OCX68044.1 hypothetical protein A6P07_18920 [Acidithiobacillus thiooxidans]OCX68302.1 hypothetical protein A6O24_19845 [Acidithiobacillus thiooxidans]OCX73686.1 hypothetical protein A6M23_07775 [Acidithiobacillus thiooxidans]OCX80160.1 hypothetical protein A6O26_15580 [Acidithiobacillus thiooxidans]
MTTEIKPYMNFTIDFLVDETLREGAERSAFAVTEESRFRLLEKMIDAGLREFVLGISPETPKLLKMGLQAKHAGFFPVDCKFIWIALLNSWETTYEYIKTFPAAFLNDFTLSFGMIEMKSDQGLFEMVIEKFRRIGVKQFKASILANFKSEIEENFKKIDTQVRRCLDSGLDVIRINDSVGALFPESTYALCRRLVSDYPNVNFCLHAHDDRGLAVANALTSVYAGFKMIEGSLAGLGNRAGLPSVELLAKIAQDKGIVFGNAALEVDRLIEVSRFADEIFMNIPNAYRPVSGLFVDRVNLGVLNIPDYLEADGERQYVMNIAAIHPKTVQDALRAIHFDADKINDMRFIVEMMEMLRSLMQKTYENEGPAYQALIEQMKTFYSRAWLTLDDIRSIAMSLAPSN